MVPGELDLQVDAAIAAGVGVDVGVAVGVGHVDLPGPGGRAGLEGERLVARDVRVGVDVRKIDLVGLAMVEVLDDVPLGRAEATVRGRTEGEMVGAGAAVQVVLLAAPVQDVVAGAAGKRVVAGSPKQIAVPALAHYPVVASHAVHLVSVAVATEEVVEVAAVDVL